MQEMFGSEAKIKLARIVNSLHMYMVQVKVCRELWIMNLSYYSVVSDLKKLMYNVP